ncbi:inorganic phosphate transporter [Helicobacter sp. 11S02596-1]|uniref:inorganic phosphate transporter n=1 Tax=Helicobacter sp. 11S02596-1 TaxID=1476194 RepID=UPI000BA69A9C|nr:inorganic phosphate transporter [Helicobacter sp. 11S02596-1]PAF45103.1 inorganic phosphate transporter [Helicobacter sp. 11S02596-1]
MEIQDINQFQKANKKLQKESSKIAIVMVFAVFISIIALYFGNTSNPLLLVFTTIIGGYMAMSIGANDVANNVGPAVGSKAITLFGAIIIAAFCEALGAIIAGGEVVDTIKSGIIDPISIADPKVFVGVMIAALVSGAIWVHLATIIGAPVSTTHSIVGGILGAGIAAGGLGVANWGVFGSIVASWIVSPLLGALIAMIFLMAIKKTITYKQNKKLAAKKVVPLLIFIMTWAFTLYLMLKGLKKIYSIDISFALGISFLFAVLVYFLIKPLVAKKALSLQNTKEDINTLFTIPLVFAAALLSFAHGANDVANAIGPLAAINQALGSLESVGKTASVPLWIMVIGGLGISLGLALYGPKLIKTVGSEITELDKIRAFCIAMSAALTVLVASALGLPVSSTHIAIGAVFGVGFLREYLKKRYYEMQQTIINAHSGKDSKAIEEFLEKFNKASVKRKGAMLESLKKMDKKSSLPNLNKKEKKSLKKVYKNELVKRSAINKIVASWIITVPVSAVLGAVVYFIVMAVGPEL